MQYFVARMVAMFPIVAYFGNNYVVNIPQLYMADANHLYELCDVCSCDVSVLFLLEHPVYDFITSSYICSYDT